MNMFARITASKGVFLAALAVGAITGTAFLGGGITPHHIVARFRDADGLVRDNEVRIAGVRAGHVESVAVGTDGHGQQYAEATLVIDPANWPLRRGTQVAVRPRGVLSEMYVDLTQGAGANAALPDGYRYEAANTSSPVNLDELTNVFDANVRTAIRTQLQEGVIALGNGGAANLNQTLGNARPLLADAVPVTSVLAARVTELDRLNVEFDRVTAMLAREDAHLRTLITDSDTTFGALAAKELQLQDTLVHAQGTLQSVDTGLKGEEGNLQLIFQKGPQALINTKNAADLLTPLIHDVNPHIASLDVLLQEFVTATGFNTNTINGIDTLRVDGTLPPSDHTSQECGGAPADQSAVVGRPGCNAATPSGGSGG